MACVLGSCTGRHRRSSRRSGEQWRHSPSQASAREPPTTPEGRAVRTSPAAWPVPLRACATRGFSAVLLYLPSDQPPDGHVVVDDHRNPQPVGEEDGQHQAWGSLAHEVGERDRYRDDRLLDPVILQENGLCGDVAAGLPKHAAEHEATGSRLALGLALIVAGGLLSGGSVFLMGRAWRIGLDPANRTELAEDGPYRWIR